MDANLAAAVDAWTSDDPDPRTVAELRAVVASGDEDEVRDRFDGRLVFGTAGIRGAVAAGPNRMNLAVVRQTAWGLAQVLLAEAEPGTRPRVVVGNDARPDSPAFARDLGGVLAAAGIDVSCFDQPVPTPLVAWLARREQTDAAVVVTASHNPRPDNGIKVYDRRAIQIIPPTDTHVAEAIEAAPGASSIPVDLAGVRHLDAMAVEAEYREALRSHLAQPSGGSDLTIVATALHGVGAGPLTRLLGEAGHTVVHVPEQQEPDGTFPTLAFPNPEEPGALDLALALARQHGADLVLANDPDADRFALALPDDDGGHSPLTGNEIGALLGDALLESVGGDAEMSVVACSIVSSPQLAMIAARYGAEHRFTLTGFKWIWTALLDAEVDGLLPLFGFEEALGFAVDAEVRDKDGLSAALAVVELAARERRRGRSLAHRLDDIARTTGLWVSVQSSARFDGDEAADLMASAMARLRAAPPDGLDGLAVVSTTDFQLGAGGRPPWLGPHNLLANELRGDEVAGRVLVRPSGTEPKLKVYVDLHLAGVDPERPRARRDELVAQAERVALAMLRVLGLR